MPSPANVICWQAGDSFDFAIVLCSLLLGTGYDAYVVYGTAPKAITTKDESLMDCPPDLKGLGDDLGLREADSEDPYFDADEKHMHKKKELEHEFAAVNARIEEHEASYAGRLAAVAGGDDDSAYNEQVAQIHA